MISCLPDSHYLQRLFAADTGACFEIALKRSRRNIIPRCEFINWRGEIILLIAGIHDGGYDIYCLLRIRLLCYNRLKIISEDLHSLLKASCLLDGLDNGVIQKVA